MEKVSLKKYSQGLSVDINIFMRLIENIFRIHCKPKIKEKKKKKPISNAIYMEEEEEENIIKGM